MPMRRSQDLNPRRPDQEAEYLISCLSTHAFQLVTWLLTGITKYPVVLNRARLNIDLNVKRFCFSDWPRLLVILLSAVIYFSTPKGALQKDSSYRGASVQYTGTLIHCRHAIIEHLSQVS